MLFDFNLYSSLLLPAFIQGILFALLLVYRGYKESRLSDKLLALLLFLNALKISFWMLGFAGWYDSHNFYTSFMFYFPFNNVLLISPLIYFYFISLTNTNFQFQKIHRKHLVLPCLWLVFIAAKFIADFALYYPFQKLEAYQYGTKGEFAELDKSLLINILSYSSFFYYVFITLKEFHFYKIYVNQNFSFTENIDFVWLRNVLLALVTGGVLMFVFIVISFFNNGLSYLQDWYAYFILGILTYYISINGYFTNFSRRVQLQYIAQAEIKEEQKTVLEYEQNEVAKLALELATLGQQSTKMQENSLPKTEFLELNNWKERLETYINLQAPYLNPELSLAELAKQLQTNQAIISRTINEGFGQNFNDYINTYRLKEVLKKLDKGEHKQHTIEGIAYDCGFNSKPTFNRAFKKLLNKTPLEYIKEGNN